MNSYSTNIPEKTTTIMKPSLRIAILMCDSPLPLTTEKYGSYGGVFKALIEKSAESLKDEIPGIGDRLELTSWNVYQVGEYPELGDIDAILLTGSSKHLPKVLCIPGHVRQQS